MFEAFKEVPNEQKKEFGKQLNILKQLIQDTLERIQAQFETNESVLQGIDVTLPEKPIMLGSRHPLSIRKIK